MITIGSLFSGIGGLELGLQMAGCGPVLWQCDSDPYARAVLAEHHPGVRVYEDVRQIDAGTAQPVGLVCGGFPCQPHSLAGKRKGTADARWLWPEFERIIRVLAPPLVFIENVPGLRTSGLRHVLASLAALRFDAVWDCFSAAEVGAPHIRRRLFVLAYADRFALRLQPGRGGGASGKKAPVSRRDGVDGIVANANGEGQLRAAAPRLAGGHGPRERSDVANSEGKLARAGRQQSRRGQAGRNVHQWLVEPDVGRVAHGVPARTHRLRLLGNAVVPAQAAHAFQVLAARAAEGR